MSGLGIKLYTDEDVNARLAEQLRRDGYDAISCRDAGNQYRSLSDEWQLRYATGQGRAILVHNIRDYLPLDRAWRSRGEDHYGIILVEHLPIGDLVRRARHHLDSFSPQYHHNLVIYLADLPA